MTSDITMYGVTWCGDCHRARRFFDNYGINYTFIDIDQDSEAEAFVLAANNGNRSVPTIIFPDGSKLVEPSTRVLADVTGVAL